MKIVLKKNLQKKFEFFFIPDWKKIVYSFDAEKVDLSIAGVFGTILALFLALPNTWQKNNCQGVSTLRATPLRGKPDYFG